MYRLCNLLLIANMTEACLILVYGVIYPCSNILLQRRDSAQTLQEDMNFPAARLAGHVIWHKIFLVKQGSEEQKQAFLTLNVSSLLSNVIRMCVAGVAGGIAVSMLSDAVLSAQYYGETGDGSMLGMYHSMHKAAKDPSAENLKELGLSEFFFL